MRIEENISLAPLTTFHIGGMARFLIHIRSAADLEEAQKLALEKGVSLFVLGGGSNVLMSDEGFPGIVAKIELEGISIESQDDENVLLFAAAGENWDKIVARTIEENVWGIENLSGIPGTLGGAIVQNIGAYGQAISERVEWVEVFDIQTGEIRSMSPEECAFDYRDSFFKHDDGRHIVLKAALRLSKNPKPNLSYRDLHERFADHTAALTDVRTAVLTIRAQKFPNLSKEGSAGSFFKNPILPADEARALQAQFPEMPLFSMPETGGIKVPLAWLLDKVLGLRGQAMGGARLFENQPLVIAAKRGTRAEEVLALAASVRTRMREAFGFEIEPEVKIIL